MSAALKIPLPAGEREGPTPQAWEGEGAALRLLLTADAVGGVWTYARELALALGSRGIAITIALVGPGDPDTTGLDVVRVGGQLDWLADDAAQVRATGETLAALARARGVDLVQLNTPAHAAGVAFPVPVVAVAHSCVGTWWAAVKRGPIPDDLAWRAALHAEGLRAAAVTIAPTAAHARATAALYGVHMPLVVPNARGPSAPSGHLPVPGRINEDPPRHGEVSAQPTEGYPPRHGEVSAQPTEGYRPHHGGGVTAFTAGRLWDEGKGIDLLDEAAAVCATPVGAAGAAAGPNGERIAFRNIVPLGQLSPAALARELALRPVFVSPARYEPFGLAVLEAALAGCPLVLSDIAPFRELWHDAALFVTANDAAAFAAAIDHLAADRAEAARLGAAARARAGRYTPDVQADLMLGLYRAALAHASVAA